MFAKKFKERDVLEIVAALAAAWICYQLLGAVTGTSMPLVSVVSDSMEPVLHRGDLLLITSEKEYNINDIVVYQNSHAQYTIVHRIIGKQTQNGTVSFVVKGDNNAAPDPFMVAPSEIRGKATFAVPLLGYPRLALMVFGI